MSGPEHPLWRVWRRLEQREAIVAGVLSGTSADGIDVALLRCGSAGASEPLAFRTCPFPELLAKELRAVLDGELSGARELAFLTRDLGRAFGRAARTLADERRLTLDLVGSHGQTVYHHDGREPAGAASLQLGDGDFVAHEARAVTVSDFRSADLAFGGEGAPLSALVDPELFPGLDRPAAILNLGGIANVTYLGSEESPLAFDTGPANALLDGLARRLLDRPCDLDGRAALRGHASRVLLSELLQHPYFSLAPPKSTGRDTFGAAYISHVLERVRALELEADDTMATGVELVAESVARALRRWLPRPPRELVLCGGGVQNRALFEAITRRTGLPTVSSSERGVDPDGREALIFGLLAVRCVLALPSTAPRVTGARPGGVLGKLSWPPQVTPAVDSVLVPRSQGRNPG